MTKSKFAALAAAVLFTLSACGESVDLSPANKEIDQVVDVRTADEFNAGHVDGAINIDVESGDFETLIQDLDPNQTYLVYCRTGRRSAIATQMMSDAGLTVLDGGGLTDMEGRGWQFVA